MAAFRCTAVHGAMYGDLMTGILINKKEFFSLDRNEPSCFILHYYLLVL